LYQLGQSFPFLKFIGGPVRAGSEDAANEATKRQALAGWLKAHPGQTLETSALEQGQNVVKEGGLANESTGNFMNVSGGFAPREYSASMIQPQMEAESSRHAATLRQAAQSEKGLEDYRNKEIAARNNEGLAMAIQNFALMPAGPEKEWERMALKKRFPEGAWDALPSAAKPTVPPPPPEGANGLWSKIGELSNPTLQVSNLLGKTTSNMHPLDALASAAQGTSTESPWPKQTQVPGQGSYMNPGGDPAGLLNALIQFLTSKRTPNANFPQSKP
jgi:hypothetical protein